MSYVDTLSRLMLDDESGDPARMRGGRLPVACVDGQLEAAKKLGQAIVIAQQRPLRQRGQRVLCD